MLEQNLLPTCFISGHQVPLSCHPLMLSIPGFEVVVLGSGHHSSSLLRMVSLVLPLGFPFPNISSLSGCWDPLDLCRQLWGREGSADGAPAIPLPGSVSHPCRAGTLNVAMVIKAHSLQLPRKRSTPQIRYTTYGPVNFPKRSLFVRFKQGFMLHP